VNEPVSGRLYVREVANIVAPTTIHITAIVPSAFWVREHAREVGGVAKGDGAFGCVRPHDGNTTLCFTGLFRKACYSNKTRGQTAQRQSSTEAAVLPVAPSPTSREARKGWAALIKQVYEADPLTCPKCGATMRMVAFIERHQTAVIEKILRHCGLWEDAPARGPPAPAGVTVER